MDSCAASPPGRAVGGSGKPNCPSWRPACGPTSRTSAGKPRHRRRNPNAAAPGEGVRRGVARSEPKRGHHGLRCVWQGPSCCACPLVKDRACGEGFDQFGDKRIVGPFVILKHRMQTLLKQKIRVRFNGSIIPSKGRT